MQDAVQRGGKHEDGDDGEGKDRDKICRPPSPAYRRYVHSPIDYGGKVAWDGVVGEATHNHEPGVKELPSDSKSI
jgi:hypothetical protein